MADEKPAWSDDKEIAANLIKQMREGGLLNDGSSLRLAVPVSEEAETAIASPLLLSNGFPSWHCPDAIVRAPSGSMRPPSRVASADSFIERDGRDEESRRRASLESGADMTEPRPHQPPSSPGSSLPDDEGADSSNAATMASRMSFPPPVGMFDDKEHIFVWVDIDVALLDAMQDTDVMLSIDKRNKGQTEDVADWLVQGLKPLNGPVDWLLKVRVPEGVKKGQKLSLMCNGVKVKATYNGKASDGGRAVFAVQEREVKPSISRRISKTLASAMRRRSAE